MENRTTSMETQIIATGVFKKRMWPWLFVFLAALVTIASYAQIAIEFFSENNLCPYCTDFFSYYFFHYEDYLITTFVIVGSLIVLAILCAIIFIRKRVLVITTTAILFKKGENFIKIPLSTIENIDTGANSILVFVPFKKFKFANLQNKKELYDTLLSQLTSSTTPVASTTHPPILQQTTMDD